MRIQVTNLLVWCALAVSTGTPTQTARLAPLPEATSSFGAAVAGGWLYVYGGHVAETHAYSAAAMSGQFHRRRLTDGAKWEVLPSGPSLQGLGLVAHGEVVYRVGGMKATNAMGSRPDTVSVSDVSQFDSRVGAWRQMPPLPAPRSSHDVVVVGNSLYAVGGWTLHGGEGRQWHRDMAVLDLAASTPRWTSVPQPFARRALTAAALGTRIFVLGGVDESEATHGRVDVYDTVTGRWSRGPELPGGEANAFGPAACTHRGQLYVALGNGTLHRLTRNGDAWEAVGRFTPRIVARAVGDGARMLILGGADGRRMTDLVEAVPIASESDDSSGAAAEARHDAPGSRVWPAFRGDGTSHTTAQGLPTTWSDEAGVAWRTALEGRGQSSPVVWHDAVYVTAVAGVDKETLIVSRVALGDGRVVWQRRFAAARRLVDTDTTSKAAPTPVVDADGVSALFESGDLIALTPNGELRWRRSLMDDYGDIRIGHQYGSSPAIAPGRVVVFVGHAGPSYLVSIDTTDGHTRWKADRPSVTSWNTPIIGGRGEEAWIAVPTKTGHDGHRLKDGVMVWSRHGVAPAPMASATPLGDRLVVPSSTKGGSGMLVIATESPAWVSADATADFASPLVANGMALFVNPVGVLYAADIGSGAVLWHHRLPGANWASPLFDGRHAYFFGVNGSSVVLEPKRDGPSIVAENSLSVQGRVYGVAAVDGALILRTDHSLIRLSPR